jgi:hypothetical protein
VEILNQLSETGHRKGPDFGPIGLSTITVLQLLRHSLSSSFWTKNLLLKLNTHPIPLILAPNDSWLFPKIKSATME